MLVGWFGYLDLSLSFFSITLVCKYNAYTHVATTYSALCSRQRSLCFVERNSNKMPTTGGILYNFFSLSIQHSQWKKNIQVEREKNRVKRILMQNNSQRDEKSSGQSQEHTIFWRYCYSIRITESEWQNF